MKFLNAMGVSLLLSVGTAIGVAQDAVAPPSPSNQEVVRKVGGGVSPPQVLATADPQFSEEARKDKVSGSVLVHLLINKEGLPVNVKVVRGIGHGLDEKAVEAVKQYRFKPAQENGVAVDVEINIVVNFQIYNRPPQ